MFALIGRYFLELKLWWNLCIFRRL